MKLLRPPLSGLVLLAMAGVSVAQSGPPAGPRQVDPRWHAFTGATVVTAPGQVTENATLVIRGGVVESVEAGGAPPAGARVWPSDGSFIYAGLIEPHLGVEAPLPEPGSAEAHWNPKVTPQRSPLAGEGVPVKTREELRAMGFAAAAIAPDSGVLRGRGAVVLLADPTEVEGARHLPVVTEHAFETIAFDRSGEGYPRSLMGCVAAVRQSMFDIEWYANNREVFATQPEGLEPPPISAALEALVEGREREVPLFFVTDNELEALTAMRLAQEFGRSGVVVGSGTEYRRLDALVQAGARIILPLDFPEAPDVSTMAKAENVTLRELMGWEQAPTNARRIARAGLECALTTHRLDKRSDFVGNLRVAMEHGLTDEEALAMLTTRPARMLGVDDQLGEIAPGRIANLVVTDGPLFAKDTEVLDVWVRGQRHVVHDPRQDAVEGAWSLTTDTSGLQGTLRVAKGKVTLEVGEEKLSGRKVVASGDRIDFLVDGDAVELPGVYAMSALVEGGELFGSGRAPDGTSFSWRGAPDDAAAGEDDVDSDEVADHSDVPEMLPTPFGAFGVFEQPKSPYLVRFVNVTLWMAGAGNSRMDDAAMVIRDGKIAWIGPPDAVFSEEMVVIDAKGKHITPGLIDCHSHTGMRKGVNEGTQAVTAEVRVQDCLDPDDINWYRQLAGGVTMAHQLHGSANPVGGQSSVVKLRWGVPNPDKMRARGAKSGIKFALGENVKRSRTTRGGSTRYPTSRMGVEVVIRDSLTAARQYSADWQAYRRMSAEERARSFQPRRDLELDALAEILANLRQVHCHAYRQDEILMLCRVAGDFGFRIGTIQHGLEAYKVGEVLSDVTQGASVFSDWWAYKFEVFDAIPHNGAILHKLGVPVSFNSDSSELARRLNTEAAKAIKYGDLEPATAMSFVTLGPAVQLGMRERVGSLQVGKEADFVVWSGDPLSPFSRVESTWIDGLEYFSLEKDRELRAWAGRERQRLLQKVLSSKKKPKKADKPEGEEDGR